MLGATCDHHPLADARGVLVTALNPQGLAYESRLLKVGDVLLAVNGTPTNDPAMAAAMLREAHGIVRVDVLRGLLNQPKSSIPSFYGRKKR